MPLFLEVPSKPILDMWKEVVLLLLTTENPYPTKINFEGSNLGIGSYEDLTLTNVAIDVGGNLALGTLSDMHITQTKISVGRHSDRDNVYMYADELLSSERPDLLWQRQRDLHGSQHHRPS